MSYKKHQLITLASIRVHPRLYFRVSVTHLFKFFVLCFCFGCLCSVSCVQCCLCLLSLSPVLKSWGACCTFCPIVCLYVLSFVLWCPLRFQHKTNARFIITLSCLSYLRHLCVFAYIGVQHFILSYGLTCCDCHICYDLRTKYTMFVLLPPPSTPLSCLWKGCCLLYAICVCLRILVSNTSWHEYLIRDRNCLSFEITWVHPPSDSGGFHDAHLF